MARRLGAWNCPYCLREGMWGNEFYCKGCGAPRPRNVHFHHVPDGPIVTPEIAKQLGSGGPNWYCEYCYAGNRDNKDVCWRCGAARGDSPEHKVTYYKEGKVPTDEESARQASGNQSWTTGKQPERPAAPGTLPTGNINTPKEPEEPVFDLEDTFSTPPTDFSSRMRNIRGGASNLFGKFGNLTQNRWLIGAVGVIAGVALEFVLYQVFFNTHLEKAEIVEFSWSRKVRIEEFRAKRDSSWGSHPSDAYDISSEWKDTGRDRKVHDGWKLVPYEDTCYRTVTYQGTCTEQVYVSKTCNGVRDNGDGSFSDYTYECGGWETNQYPCTKTREEPYTCTKTRREEEYHYEDVFDTHYTYTVNRWVSLGVKGTSGRNREPYYASPTLKEPFVAGSSPSLGQQKRVELPGTYRIKFHCRDNERIGDEGYFSKNYSLEEWNKFDPERSYTVEVNPFNRIIKYPEP